MNTEEILKNIALERSVISYLLQQQTIHQLRSIFLEPTDSAMFTDPCCRAAYKKMRSRLDDSPLSDNDCLSFLHAIGREYGFSVEVSSDDKTESEKNDSEFEYIAWVQQLNDLHLRRKLFKLLRSGQEKLLRPNSNLGQLLKSLSYEMKILCNTCTKNGNTQSVKNALLSVIDEVLYLFSKNAPQGIPSGLKKFDTYTSGFLPGRLYLFVGTAGSGKTALALSITSAAMKEEFVRVGFASSQHSVEDLLRPLLYQHSDVVQDNVYQGHMDDESYERMLGNVEKFIAKDIDFRSLRNRTITDVRNHAFDLAENKSAQNILLVDDAELLQGNETSIEQVCKSLKAIATDLDLPVLAFCKMASDDDEDSWMETNALREEQLHKIDADIIVILENDDPEEAELFLLRNPGRPMCRIPIQFDYGTYQFSERAEEE
jgi:replicative DNA helicase